MNMYPAKILLFGEYSLLHGSHALAVPFRNYFGQWSKSEYCTEFTYILAQFANYLEDKQGEAPFKIEIQNFRNDIASGLYFESSIPMSYGLGSSGALCAAFYKTYVTNPIPPNCNDEELLEMKRHFSFLEKYFHGTSSGMDPLVSYTNSILLFGGMEHFRKLNEDQICPGSIAVFLIDTERYGHTGNNIRLFNDLLKEGYYSKELKNNYNPLVNKCITYYLRNKPDDFFASIHDLSQSQLSFFEPMIPSDFLKYFQIAHETRKFSLKLCGSGGGGFLLGFTTDMEYVNTFFNEEGVKVVPVNI